jgi:small-conductance mechanosensitive channel
MAWFRKQFCAQGTYNTLCVVPIGGWPIFDSQDEWCEFYYNTNTCAGIQSSAQTIMVAYSYVYYNINGGIGLFLVLLVSVVIIPLVGDSKTCHALNLNSCLSPQLSLTFSLVEGMITKPVVQKNRESHIASWLFLPIVLCFASGSVLIFHSSSILSIDAGASIWPGVLLIAAGILYSIAAVLGYLTASLPILNTRDKKGKLFALTLFIGTMFLACLSMGEVFKVHMKSASPILLMFSFFFDAKRLFSDTASH